MDIMALSASLVRWLNTPKRPIEKGQYWRSNYSKGLWMVHDIKKCRGKLSGEVIIRQPTAASETKRGHLAISEGEFRRRFWYDPPRMRIIIGGRYTNDLNNP